MVSSEFFKNAKSLICDASGRSIKIQIFCPARGSNVLRRRLAKRNVGKMRRAACVGIVNGFMGTTSTHRLLLAIQKNPHPVMKLLFMLRGVLLQGCSRRMTSQRRSKPWPKARIGQRTPLLLRIQLFLLTAMKLRHKLASPTLSIRPVI